MRTTGKLAVRLGLAVAVATLLSGAARASDAPFPSRPIRLIVPYAAGGGPDVLARKTAEVVSRELGQPVVVENKVGAGGILAAEVLAQQPADGYTLMIGASTHVTQKLMQPSVKFDPATLTHVIRTGFSPQVMVVKASTPYRTVADVAQAARNAPGTLNYASGGIGSAAHLAGAAFANAVRVEMVHIPYKGSVEIVPSLIRGDTTFGFPVASTAMPPLATGTVRALAVTSAHRLPILPGVPTLNEALGRQDLVLDSWSGIWAPAGVPKPVVARLHAAFRKALSDPAVRDFYEKAASVIDPTPTPEAFSRFIAEETAKYRRIVELSRIAVQ
ncbi:tripartite tricarboxylate transporter substrate binding protein [Cupriavidus sp. UGS-1]|uniref:Bug family tripartite tricarboxylate transporter substrate binding protein n=1 Tax=Cupriavidus sp. UGS-1 TaxID=2899826 RepID=UPI001E2A72CC|nr:tripartite tricarboxylate transporter substrate binding protein [Cupriavidus sp. UGS-1]